MRLSLMLALATVILISSCGVIQGIPVASCPTNPCLNNGQCETISSGNSVCHCTLDYIGDLCEFRIKRISDALPIHCSSNESATETCEQALDDPGSSGLSTQWEVDDDKDGKGAEIIINLKKKYPLLGIKFQQLCSKILNASIEKISVSFNDGTILLVDMSSCTDVANSCNDRWDSVMLSTSLNGIDLIKITVLKICSGDVFAEIGFRDISFFTPYDDCAAKPCLHGKCENDDYGYRCICEPGYGGVNCSTRLHCFSSPCLHNGTCVEDVKRFRCICPVRYRGRRCKTDKGCIGVSPSLRRECGFPGIKRGKCLKKDCCFDRKIKNAIWCFKPVKVNPCKFLTCQNGGTCVKVSNIHAKCSCTEGRTGVYCEKKVNGTNTCDVKKKEDCGYPGIMRVECEGRGCCFTPIYGEIWCFYSNIVE